MEHKANKEVNWSAHIDIFFSATFSYVHICTNNKHYGRTDTHNII